MNITRRGLLKTLSMGAAVAASGVAIATGPRREDVGADSPWSNVQDAIKLMESSSNEEATKAVLEVWSPSVEYTAGKIEEIKGSDGRFYQAVHENGMYTLRRKLGNG